VIHEKKNAQTSPSIHFPFNLFFFLSFSLTSLQGDVNNALVHELIHAYDHCRAATLDWSACQHHACSEIRAATLSGDCTFRQEAARGNWTLRAGAQACAARRAALSVAMNPHCAGPGVARKAVDAVFDKCFADTAPFDRIP
jgi:inner membrane protease ATP23